MSSLRTASCLSVPCVTVPSLKPFWNEELERLKDGLVLFDLNRDITTDTPVL